MRTRDGISLIADIYRPDITDAELPTLVRRTPYGKNANDLADAFNEADYYASHGYLVVIQNTRGRFGSQGKFYPFVYEGQDGYDTIEWAASLPGSSGLVGTFGQSYGALSQYLAAAQRPPHLVTCVPVSAYLGAFENYWYQRGALELSWTLSYFLNMAESALAASGDTTRLAELQALKTDPDLRFAPLTDDALRHLPLTDWIDRFGAGAPFLADVLHHWTDGGYWWAVDLRRQFQNMDVAMLHVGSWYDIANWDTPQYYAGLQRHAITAQARTNQSLLLGPWSHLLPYSQPTSGGTGDIDFGPSAAVSLVDTQRAWFDRHLKSHDRPGDPNTATPVRIFVMGDNVWRNEQTWPPHDVVYTDLYLRSGGNAATAAGDGTLNNQPADNNTADTYRYDPQNPVPTAGGRYVGGGVRDQAANQARTDVLVYTAAQSKQRLEITGPLSCTLFIATTAVDTDFVAVLSDIHPNGFVQNLSEGIVRTRFRDRYDDPSPLTPGEIYELVLDLGNLSHAVLPGHQLRLHITSSDFPRWDRNTNTGQPAPTATTMKVAQQTVFHGREHPSKITLPIIGPRQAG